MGGSYIAVETSGFLASLGCDTTISIRSSVLRGFDDECSKRVVSSLTKRNVKIFQPCDVLKISKTDKGLEVEMKSQDKNIKEVYDTLMTSIGRNPSNSGLNLEIVNMKVENGHVVVDDSFKQMFPIFIQLEML